MQYIELLERKWGKFEATGHSLVNGKMPFVSDVARLNMLFTTESVDLIASRVHDRFHCDLPEQLIEFYKELNGCRLFFGSLNVFGIQNYPTEVYQPYDIFTENNHILGSIKGTSKDKCNMLFVASIGGDYAFGFDRDKPAQIIGIKKGADPSPVQAFPDFNSFFGFHFNRLINEYSADCKKIHPSSQFKGIPALENITIEIQ